MKVIKSYAHDEAYSIKTIYELNNGYTVISTLYTANPKHKGEPQANEISVQSPKSKKVSEDSAIYKRVMQSVNFFCKNKPA